MANLSKVLKDILGETRSSDSRYFRFHDSPDGMSDWGHAMYIEARPGQSVHDVNAEMSNYGNNAFEFNYKKGNVVPVSALNKDILKEYSSSYRKGSLPPDMEDLYTNGGKARDLLESFNPGDIVNSAEAYDNPAFTGWLFENVLAPRGIQGVLTQDGAISFEKKLNKLLGSRDDGGDLPSHIRSFAPWAIGGGLAAGSMLGANEAQATPRLSPDLAAWAKSAEKSQALQEPVWSPSDLFVAPIGAAGIPAKAAAMALDAPVSMALNEVLDYINSGATAVADWWRR